MMPQSAKLCDKIFLVQHLLFSAAKGSMFVVKSDVWHLSFKVSWVKSVHAVAPEDYFW